VLDVMGNHMLDVVGYNVLNVMGHPGVGPASGAARPRGQEQSRRSDRPKDRGR